MPRRIFLVMVLAGAVASGMFWWFTAAPVSSALTAPAHAPDVVNGRTTFTAAGCSSCHAVPDQPERLRLVGGLAMRSPFGSFYSPNIPPDPAGGICSGTEA